MNAPVVGSVSFGPLWLLTKGARTPDLFTVFVEHVMPRIEREVGGHIEHRHVVGESMGGYNALLVGLRTEHTFERVVSLCAPLSIVSAFGAWRDIIFNQEAASNRAIMLFTMSRHFFGDERQWRANDPVSLAETFSPSAQFYISCGRKDEWGCRAGSEALVTNMQKHGTSVQWALRDGGHCDIDFQAVAAFLTGR